MLDNGGAPELNYWYATLCSEGRSRVSRAHDAIWQHVKGRPPPYDLAGYAVADGLIFDDPAPGPEYSLPGQLAGAWIWSSQWAYFRFRAILTKSKLDIWDLDRGRAPAGVALPPIMPRGKIQFSTK